MTNSEVSPGEIYRAVLRTESAVGEIEKNFLTKAEFQAWKRGFDREIADMKASRAPWWQAAALAISTLSMVLVIFLNLNLGGG